ncbi:MAG: hypothetical protein HYX66_00770 [Ignavibacteria bacterium]|nr:hypothetical protein [Ignavibacteria bacterium]
MIFKLHALGWNNFQQLCLTITTELLGQTVESFLDSNDGGRDGAFTGIWTAKGEENLNGTFVIQCKYSSREDYNLKWADLQDELDKLCRLKERNLCDVYVLMTNAGVTGKFANRFASELKSIGIIQTRIFGSTWIRQLITENKRLRMLVPRLYGLGDLSQILDERAYLQARTVLETMREDLAKVVVTDAYRKAIRSINDHGFVLLIGEPAAGKSTISSMLAVATIDQWDATTLKLDDPSSVVKHWNPDEPSQFFWLDDAFGVSQYESELVRGWNHVFPQVLTMIHRGAKIVMTSRDYIYNRARSELKMSAFPMLEESKVVIDVQNLTDDERRRILYNHLKLGRQPRSFLTEVKPFLESIATNPRFIPETARRLGDPLFTRRLQISKYYVNQFVEQREQLLQEIIQGLDDDCKSALALIHMRNGRLHSPIQMLEAEQLATERLGSSLGGCVKALNSLQNSLVMLMQHGSEKEWHFKHPTIGDAFSKLLMQNSEYLDIFIRGNSAENLVGQITCGDVGLETAIVIPTTLFSLVIDKLDGLSKSDEYKSGWLSEWSARGKRMNFLARRCTKEFLTTYMRLHTELLDVVSEPGMYLDSVPEVSLANRLYEYGMLPEVNRKKFSETAIRYAVEDHDSGAFYDDDVKELITQEEQAQLTEQLRAKVIPNLDELRRTWQSNFNGEEPADDYMQQYISYLERLQVFFDSEVTIANTIARQVEKINSWVNENAQQESVVLDRSLAEMSVQMENQSERSMFDDIDLH